LGISVRLKKADYLKFIVIINPGNTLSVQLNIAYKFVEESGINVIAKLSNGEVVCFKFQGRFVREVPIPLGC
jgi:3-hydroxyacyl-[acyl-carrier-protein] dehydratase